MGTMMDKENNYSLLTQKESAFKKIKEGILSSRWSLGSRLVERQLCAELGVSRTPIREAFSRLEREGLVELIPQWGVFVKKLSKSDILEIYEVRDALEGLAVRLAAKNAEENDIKTIRDMFRKMEKALENANFKELNEADNAFHFSIIKASHNKKLLDFVSMCHINVFNMPGNGNPPDYASQQRSMDEHRKILQNMVNKKGKEAEEALRKHLKNAKNRAEEQIHQEP